MGARELYGSGALTLFVLRPMSLTLIAAFRECKIKKDDYFNCGTVW